MSSPELTVLIVNWNTRELLRSCLQSIEPERRELDLEVLVVDNASADGSAEMVRSGFPQVRLIESGGNLGFGRGNNLALPQASAPLVLFLNPDTEVRPGALRAMVDFMQQSQSTGAVGCRIVNEYGHLQELGLQASPSPWMELVKLLLVSNKASGILKRLPWRHDPTQDGPVKKLYASCLMVRRSVLESVGSFDERFFMYCEDVDLCHRIDQAGHGLYYLSQPEIVHYCGKASESAPSDFSTLMMCESIAMLMEKYYGTVGRLLYRGIVTLSSLARLAVLTLSGLRGAKEGVARKYKNMLSWSLKLRSCPPPA